MKKVNILVDREPLSRDFVKSKQNFGKVLSHVKPLKPPVWKSPWFYGPVGLAVVALSVTAVNSLPPDESTKTLRLESVLPIEQRKIEAKTLAFVSPKEENTSFRETIPQINELAKVDPIIQYEKVEEVEAKIDLENNLIEPIAVQPVEKEERRPLTRFPSINRVYTGEITISELCSNGIECLDSKITSFSLEYYNGRGDVVEQIRGNSINSEICESISKFNINGMIFITKIRAISASGKEISYPSMNLIPVINKY